MFAIRASTVLAAAARQARFAPATRAASTGAAFGKEKTLKQVWLGDKGAWPVIAICGFAVTLCAGWGSKILLLHPDVRISKETRKATLRAAVN